MGKRKRNLVGPWSNIHTAVWLIGLGILFWKGWWWPGILILVGISTIIEALLARYVPESTAVDLPPTDPAPPADTFTAPAFPQAAVTSQPGAAPINSEHPDLLPTNCPRCGGPLRSHEVRWTGIRSADCPYCGANIPMEKELK